MKKSKFTEEPNRLRAAASRGRHTESAKSAANSASVSRPSTEGQAKFGQMGVSELRWDCANREEEKSEARSSWSPTSRSGAHMLPSGDSKKALKPVQLSRAGGVFDGRLRH